MMPRQDRTKAKRYLKKHNLKLLECNIEFVEYYIIKDRGHLPIKELDIDKLYIFRGQVKKKKRRARRGLKLILKK
jgi:hypothetical protein